MSGKPSQVRAAGILMIVRDPPLPEPKWSYIDT